MQYSDTNSNEKYKVRAFPVTTTTYGNSYNNNIYGPPVGDKLGKIGLFHNKLSLHNGYSNIISNEENNGMKGFNSFIRFIFNTKNFT